MYFDIKTNPFFQPASTMNDEQRFKLIRHYRALAMNARKEPMTFKAYVLYALLRGADIRKTSHMKDGENAIETLTFVRNEIKWHLERIEKRGQPVMNHFLQRLFGAVRKERGRPLDRTKVIEEVALTIDLDELLTLTDEGIKFYADLGTSINESSNQ